MRLPLLLLLATAPALAQSPVTPAQTQSAPPSSKDSFTILPGITLLNKNARLAPYPSPCFTMRTYAFKRDDSSSDTLRPAGFTTCQPASRLRMKQADATPSSEPHPETPIKTRTFVQPDTFHPE